MRETGGPSPEEMGIIEGDNFVLKKKKDTLPSKPMSDAHWVEFRPGESTDTVIAREDATTKNRQESSKESSRVDEIKEMIDLVLDNRDSYSETFQINSNGKINRNMRADGVPPYLDFQTPDELYQLAKQVEEKYPGYRFNFERDAEGKTIKYSVSKTETEA